MKRFLFIAFLLACFPLCAQSLLDAPRAAVIAKRRHSTGGGGGGGCTPSYANPGGTGDRTTSITVTAMGTAQGNSGDLITGGTLDHFVNGNTADNVIFFNHVDFDDLGANQPWWIQFDFGSPAVINAAKYYQQTSTDQGIWKWQGSNDASAWTDIGSTFSLVTASTTTLTTLSANTTAYRYYRILAVSGSTSNGPFIYEFEFQICTP